MATNVCGDYQVTLPDEQPGTGTGLPLSNTNPNVIYTANPNTENLTPLDPTKPAVAYSSDGSGAIYGWSVTEQVWK